MCALQSATGFYQQPKVESRRPAAQRLRDVPHQTMNQQRARGGTSDRTTSFRARLPHAHKLLYQEGGGGAIPPPALLSCNPLSSKVCLLQGVVQIVGVGRCSSMLSVHMW